MYLLVYTPTITPRIQYTWEVLLKYALRTEFFLTTDLAAYQAHTAGKINYSKQRLLAQEVFISQGNLLLESDIRQQSIQVFQHQGLPAFFAQKDAAADFPFDLAALVFYLISRYEEYLPFEADAHGRFEANQSLAFREGFLQQPLVSEWAIRLSDKLQHYFPDFNITKPTYQFKPTYDLDLPWAYRHRGWARQAGAYVRDLLKGDFPALRRRWRVQWAQETDPFFTFDFLETLHQRFELRPELFVLLGDYGAFDKNVHFKNTHFQQLIRHLHQQYQLGIHPSYASNADPAILSKEVQRLESITQEPVVRSRQHYLKLHFPQTYQRLLQLNITADYTLGYASAPGFRASIAQPFPWYDLSREEATPLLLHPFQAMDVTLKEYLQMEPSEALHTVKMLIEKTRAVGGTFGTLWHNSSFSDVGGWQDWRQVYKEMVEFATQMA